MDENKHVMPDNELWDLSELAPLTEGATLDELLEEAQRVSEAVKKTGVDPSDLDGRARALFFMRGFYFLGVLRGCEAYRASLLLDDDPNAVVPEPVPFALSDSCTEMFAGELQGEPYDTLEAIYEAVGLASL